MLKSAARRLPGIRFEPRPAPLAEALPRMDVAAFVGFAASGPLHTPVAIEDPTQFQAIFGDAAALAWDAERGEVVQAQLAAAVQGFFANGGRRCWVVRVAGDEAAFNYFALPGIAVVRPRSHRKLFPAFARARSRGSWSDGFKVATGILLQPLETRSGYDGGGDLILSAGSPKPAKGELLRLLFTGDRYQLFALAGVAGPVDGSPPGPGGAAVPLLQAAWFERIAPQSPPTGEIFTEARLYDRFASAPRAAEVIAPGNPDDSQDAPHPFERTVPAWLRFAAEAAQDDVSGEAVLELSTAPGEAPRPGSLISLSLDGEPAWLVVERLELVEAQRSPPQPAVNARGQLWRQLPGRPAEELSLKQAAVVSFDLRVQQGERAAATFRELGFAPDHARYWNKLDADEAFFSQTQNAPRTMPFPLAGAEARDAMFVPLGLTSRFDASLPPVVQTRTPLERDGLSEFSPALFLDPELAETSVDEFMAQADFIRYLKRGPSEPQAEPATRPLKGIHAILGFGASTLIEEVTLIAVPDAVHRAWRKTGSAPALAQVVLPPAAPLKRERFLDCDLRPVEPPTLGGPKAPDATGTFTLTWFSRERGRYLLEEASSPGFGDAHAVYAGLDQRCTLYSRSPGDYFYSVRVQVGRNTSDWSNVVAMRVGADTTWEVEPLKRYRDDTLVAVHRALLRMSAGRADLLALLSLPVHYREDDALAHAARLTALAEAATGFETARPLDRTEEHALSYGALYHPWLLGVRTDGRLERTPPEGAACGILALRATLRGAWIAAANEPLQGVVGVAPGAAPEGWQGLQDAQVNVVRQNPRGFLLLAEDTLSRDPDLRPINVRRLLILLRRLALRRGATYVFEPLSDAFRRMIERGFDEALSELFRRGAFAGKTPAESYQVVVGAGVNTAPALDQGRFVVELRVAPSIPMRFLSVRLVQAGERLAATEGR